MNEVDAILARAEVGQERLAAMLRIVVFLALLATVLSLQEQGAHHHPILGITMIYGSLALIGLLLAWFGIFHPLLPYLFVTVEVGLVLLQTALMASLLGQSPSSIAAMPVATIIFILLVHAAMRYRPWLVVYATALYVLGIFVAAVVMTGAPVSIETAPSDAHNLVHHQIIPIVVLMVTALILFITGRGTRNLLRVSIEERLGRTRLLRFFSPDITDQLMSDTGSQGTGGQIRPIVVLFADIRGFSALAEAMQPDALSTLLAEYREILSTAIRAHGGVVDKFIGDAVMAVFGFPDTGHSPPDRALNCARAILDGVAAWSREREIAGLPTVETGIGLHYGEAFVGIIGKESLLEFTVIGDTVNVAERIERLTRTLNADVAVSDKLVQEATSPPGPDWSLATNCALTGRNQPIDVYYLPRHTRGTGGKEERVLPKARYAAT
jgi:adenylate cyclase